MAGWQFTRLLVRVASWVVEHCLLCLLERTLHAMDGGKSGNRLPRRGQTKGDILLSMISGVPD